MPRALRPLLTVSAQDGLRPLDWALQQGHHNCAHLLRELDMPTRTRKETRGLTDELSWTMHRAASLPGQEHMSCQSLIRHMSVTYLSVMYHLYYHVCIIVIIISICVLTYLSIHLCICLSIFRIFM